MTAEIIAVVGITGNQGCSVAKIFLQEPDWTVRGITRDPSKTFARAWANRGADIVAVDLNVSGSIEKAFYGANVIRI